VRGELCVRVCVRERERESVFVAGCGLCVAGCVLRVVCCVCVAGCVLGVCYNVSLLEHTAAPHATCCGVLQRVAVCCSVLQCVAVVLPCGTTNTHNVCQTMSCMSHTPRSHATDGGGGGLWSIVFFGCMGVCVLYFKGNQPLLLSLALTFQTHTLFKRTHTHIPRSHHTHHIHVLIHAHTHTRTRTRTVGHAGAHVDRGQERARGLRISEFSLCKTKQGYKKVVEVC